MKTLKIDAINIGLVAISLTLAIYIPFKLFIFVYAFIGPLHYLTEITWLNNKSYFLKHHKSWIYVFVLLCLLMTVHPILNYFEYDFKLAPSWLYILVTNSNALLLSGFLLAVALVLLKNRRQILMACFAIVICVLLLAFKGTTQLMYVGLFLPTLIHVYLFTVLFIFFGAQKSKSKTGTYLGFLVLAVPFVISYLPIQKGDYLMVENTFKKFTTSNMHLVTGKIAEVTRNVKNGSFNFLTPFNVKVQIFVAFAYTYHYLNWFSKTSIIGWQKSITKKSAITIAVIWIASIGIYIYNYKTGFVALFFLSFLHVFLEFPLNIQSIKGLISSKS